MLHALLKVSSKDSLKPKKVYEAIYKKLVSYKQLPPTQSQKKWIADCKLENNNYYLIDWKVAYISITIQFQCTRASLQITFSYKPVICQARDKV